MSLKEYSKGFIGEPIKKPKKKKYKDSKTKGAAHRKALLKGVKVGGGALWGAIKKGARNVHANSKDGPKFKKKDFGY